MALIITALGTSIAAAIGIPILISSTKIKEAAQEAIEGELRDDILENYKRAESADAHLSRMIGILCYQHGWNLWSTGWLARSLKRYRRLHNETGNTKYKSLVRLNIFFLRRACLDAVESSSDDIGDVSIEDSWSILQRNMREPGEPLIERAERSIKDLVDVLAMDKLRHFVAEGSIIRRRPNAIDKNISDVEGFTGWLLHVCLNERKHSPNRWWLLRFGASLSLARRLYIRYILKSADRGDSERILEALLERDFEYYRERLSNSLSERS